MASISAGSAGDYLFKFLFIWLSITVAIVSLHRGKWIPNLGAIMRVLVLGSSSRSFRSCSSTTSASSCRTGRPRRCRTHARRVPVSVMWSAILGVVLYAVPVFGIILVLPDEAVTGIGWFIDAVTTTSSVYGGAADALLVLTTIGFCHHTADVGPVWMMGGDRILAVAAQDGAFPGYYGSSASVSERRCGSTSCAAWSPRCS